MWKICCWYATYIERITSLGVLGKTKFLYDVFGDTINVAARMCSTGELNKIQCCSSMMERLATNFEIEKRGVINVKGKGKIETYFVLNSKRDTLDSHIDDIKITPTPQDKIQGTGKTN